MNKKLPMYFGLWFVGFVIVLALVFPENRPVDFSVPEFRTSQADLLFFKNIRSFYYHKIEDEKSGYDILRIKSLYQDSSKTPTITFVLFNNWKQSETYIITEKNKKLVFEENLKLSWKSKDETGRILLEAFNNEAHFKFAGEVYSHLIAGDELLFEGNPIYSEFQRKSAIKTLKDYFKLVGKIY